MTCLLSLVVGSFVFVCYVLIVCLSILFFAVGSQLLLQALLVEQGLTVCRFSVCLSVYLCKIISRPLIGRKYECSDWSTSISTALRTFLGKY